MAFQSYLQKNNLTVNTMRRSMPAWSWNDYLRIFCLIFAILSLLVALAIDGTAVHTYRTFLLQRAANNPWWLPLWPQHFDTTGTKTLIGASSSILLLSIVLVVISVLPKFNQPGQSTLTTLTAIILSTASLLMALFSVVLIAVLNKRTQNSDTIQTWTCRFRHTFPAAMGMNGQDDLTNDKFSLLCTESKLGFYGMISILVLQFLLFLSAGARWFTGRQADRYTRSPVREAKEDDGFSF